MNIITTEPAGPLVSSYEQFKEAFRSVWGCDAPDDVLSSLIYESGGAFGFKQGDVFIDYAGFLRGLPLFRAEYLSELGVIRDYRGYPVQNLQKDNIISCIRDCSGDGFVGLVANCDPVYRMRQEIKKIRSNIEKENDEIALLQNKVFKILREDPNC